MAYLKIIRPINMVMLLLIQVLIKYGVFTAMDLSLAMNNFQFALLAFATLCIAAAGNIINDINDTIIDQVNKPGRMLIGKQLPEQHAYTFYIVLTCAGVGSGFILANLLGKPGLAAIFIIIAALLYSYATFLGSLLLVGNILVSALVAFALMVVVVFDIYPIIDGIESQPHVNAATLITVYAAFAFYLNLLREIVKDIQDINGDKKGGRQTLPILLGRHRARNITFVMGVVTLLVIFWGTYNYLYQQSLFVFYIVFFIGGPLLYFCIRSWDATNLKDYKAMSICLKITMFTGILSLLFFSEHTSAWLQQTH